MSQKVLLMDSVPMKLKICNLQFIEKWTLYQLQQIMVNSEKYLFCKKPEQFFRKKDSIADVFLQVW